MTEARKTTLKFELMFYMCVCVWNLVSLSRGHDVQMKGVWEQSVENKRTYEKWSNKWTGKIIILQVS
jgi:hypothetical protein